MTVDELTNETWNLWCDYYRDGDLSSDEIINEINSKIKALLKEKCAEQREICNKQMSEDECGDPDHIDFGLKDAPEPNFD